MADERLLRRTLASDLLTRSGGRTVFGIIAPFDSEARVDDGWGPYVESFKRGAFAKTIREQGQRVKLCVNHDKLVRLPIGRATMLREDAAGLYGEFRVSQTREGDDALTLVRDGVVDSFSIGFVPIQEREPRPGYVERTECGLRETSLVGFPAYAEAMVAGVRSMGVDPHEWGRMRDLVRSHPELLEMLQNDDVDVTTVVDIEPVEDDLDTPDPGAVEPIPDIVEDDSGPVEATRDDEPREHSPHTPSTRPQTSRDVRQADLARLRSMLTKERN